VDHVSRELDGHLKVLGLENDRMVLAGFSQGSALAAYTGLRRQCLGVLAMGGPCPPRLALLPAAATQSTAVYSATCVQSQDSRRRNNRSTSAQASVQTRLPTRVCLVVGDEDPYAPYQQLQAAFSPYCPAVPSHPERAGCGTDGVHVVSGMGHEVSEASAVKGQAFLKDVLRDCLSNGTSHTA
jgi:predicted esterase